MGREIVGLMACPECGNEDAQVKTAKSGYLYRYCPDCDAQFFTRNKAASDRLAAKIRPGTGTGAVQAQPEKKSGGFSLGGL